MGKMKDIYTDLQENWCDSRYQEVEQQSALARQEGGSHYTSLKIQPIEYCRANNLDGGQLNVIKYVTRFRDKNGLEDLRKAIHMLEIMIELEEKYGHAPT